MAKNYSSKGGRLGGKMTKALGRMVGLLLSLYVMDQVVTAVMPNLCKSSQCTLGGTCAISSYNASAASSAVCVWTNDSGTTLQSVATGSQFGTATFFIDNLFPIIGILGAFEIIYTSLRVAKLL